jgi:hypothetical protein
MTRDPEARGAGTVELGGTKFCRLLGSACYPRNAARRAVQGIRWV